MAIAAQDFLRNPKLRIRPIFNADFLRLKWLAFKARRLASGMQQCQLAIFVVAFLGAFGFAQADNDPIINITFVNKTGADLTVSMAKNRTDQFEFKVSLSREARYSTNAADGNIYRFRSSNPGDVIVIDDYVVSLTNCSCLNPYLVTYNLVTKPKRRNELPANYVDLGYYDPNMNGVDLLTLDPFNLDSPDSRRKPIFRRLDQTDFDYEVFDGPTVVVRGFNLETPISGLGSVETKLISSASSFQKTFSADISLGAGVGSEEEGAKGTNSASFKKVTGSGTNRKQTFTYSRQESVKYTLAPTNRAVFHPDFKARIRDLAQRADSVTAAELDHFVRSEYGSHYPTKVTYGGWHMGIAGYSEEETNKFSEWGINLQNEASVASGVSGSRALGASYGELTTSANLKGLGSQYYYYRGGDGQLNNWTVGKEAAPIKIALERISALITAENFADDADFHPADKPKKLLTLKAKMNEAITRYIGTASELVDGSPRKRVFKIRPVKMTRVELGTDDGSHDVFGNISMIHTAVRGPVTMNEIMSMMQGRNPPGFIGLVSVFSRTSQAGTRVTMEQGDVIEFYDAATSVFKVDTDTASKPFSLSQLGDIYKKFALSKQCVTFWAVLMDYDNVGDNDLIGASLTSKCFDSDNVPLIPTPPDTPEANWVPLPNYSIDLKDKGAGYIRVDFAIWESINLWGFSSVVK